MYFTFLVIIIKTFGAINDNENTISLPGSNSWSGITTFVFDIDDYSINSKEYYKNTKIIQM